MPDVAAADDASPDATVRDSRMGGLLCSLAFTPRPPTPDASDRRWSGALQAGLRRRSVTRGPEAAPSRAAVQASEYCTSNDIADPIMLLIATGVRQSELLAIRWEDVDDKHGTVAITGKVVRVKGEGLVRVETTKTAAGLRTIPLPRFALDMLTKRTAQPQLGTLGVVFPSTAGTLRDPNNFGKQWRKVRDDLRVAETTTHSFRKSVATLIDEEGLSARVGADHLGHRHVSMTQDRHMTRGRQHTAVADLLDRTVSKNDE